MNLGEFKAEISRTVGRGTALDTEIPGFIRRAAKWIERNYTYSYMRRFYLINIDIDVAETPRYIELGPGTPKSIRLFRWIDNENSYAGLSRVEPADMHLLEDGTPNGYWLDGVQRLVLNRTPDENLSGELQIDKFTAWGAEDNFTHYLLDVGEDVLLAQTLINVAVRTRDPKMLESYKEVRTEALKTLINADTELMYGGQDMEMGFSPSR